jgi:hypothetical protein
MVMPFGGPGVVPSSRGMPSSALTLSPGETFIIPPGSWAVAPGPYGIIERFDPVTGLWRQPGAMGFGINYVISDGNNYRVANRTGCAAGALLTNAGSGYTSAPVVTASAGSSTWQAVMGPLVSTTATLLTPGSNYLYPPLVQISSPSFPGIQATGHTTISGGAVASIVIDNQGGGYTSVPSINLVNDPRDSTGSGATGSLALTGQGTVAGVLCLDHGTTLTSVPTLSFSGGGGSSAAATAIMDFTLTGYTVSVGGAGFSANLEVWGVPAFVAGTAAYTNPMTQTGLVAMRRGSIVGATSGGAVTATGALVTDGGHYETVPGLVYASSSLVTTAATLVATVGGANAHILMLAV